ncbi:hypothetical protein BS78_07G065700 [Paspalum vaginatum]|nr:hypothetical protein BS78_07G065700 [Paspalum vaginatum]
MIPSSSSTTPTLEFTTPNQSAPAPPPPKSIMEVQGHCAISPSRSAWSSLSSARRSPPPVASVAMGSVGADITARGPNPSDDGNSSSEEEEEVVESDSSGVDWDGRTHFVEAWVPLGRLIVKACLAFVYLDPPEAVQHVAPFLRAALSSAAPATPLELLPS